MNSFSIASLKVRATGYDPVLSSCHHVSQFQYHLFCNWPPSSGWSFHPIKVWAETMITSADPSTPTSCIVSDSSPSRPIESSRVNRDCLQIHGFRSRDRSGPPMSHLAYSTVQWLPPTSKVVCAMDRVETSLQHHQMSNAVLPRAAVRVKACKIRSRFVKG